MIGNYIYTYCVSLLCVCACSCSSHVVVGYHNHQTSSVDRDDDSYIYVPAFVLVSQLVVSCRSCGCRLLMSMCVAFDALDIGVMRAVADDVIMFRFASPEQNQLQATNTHARARYQKKRDR